VTRLLYVTHRGQQYYVNLVMRKVMYPGDLCEVHHAYWVVDERTKREADGIVAICLSLAERAQKRHEERPKT
jgi:hypothetical protein